MVMLQMLSVLRWENGHVTEVASLKEGEWSCYRGGQFNGERERSCYGGGQFNGEVVSFMEGEWSFYRGAQFN